ncbi:type I polyketide synthase [Paenibacillus apiarius]|uniref:type I polyketide synthase n=1 Tax=Paenibacillus apiarius TaxID=46240 RepID=UPI001982171E|nr:type I polyketide synthase [Paenibacillus apiarius]MBN3526394.1 polyketide synthase dehydratase domain-containing protein [Paenibacillus apiarius]
MTVTNIDPNKLLKQSLYTIQNLRKQLDDSQQTSKEPIAVIGMACRFPGGCNSPEEYWEFLKAGGESVIDVPQERWNAAEHYDPVPGNFGKSYVRQSNFLKRNVAEFDAKFFKISPAEANAMDPQQRQLLEVCWEALENAGQNPNALRGSQTGVFIGILSNCEYTLLPRDISKVNQYVGTGTTSSIASGRISYVFGWNGPSLSIDTACSSSLVSTHLAIEALRRGECDMAVAGGVNLMLSPIAMSSLCMMNAVAADGRCKPFDATGSGYGRGEGCGILVLKRLSDAERDGDTIYALLRGGAVNNDGASSGLTVPNGKAQRMVINTALEACSLKPEDVSYLEAHGTGTPLGDPIEIDALSKIFGQENGVTKEQPLVIGAVKGNIGHLESAAGIASLIKVVLCLHHKEIPRIVNSDTPNPRINFEKIPAMVPREHMPWNIADGIERVAGVSSFGFSGTNAHIILSEAPAKALPENKAGLPSSILFLSAKDEKTLIELIRRYDSHFETHPDTDMEDACYVTNACRPDYMHRAVFLGTSLEDFRFGFKQVLREAEKEQTIYSNKNRLLGNSQGNFRTGATRALFAELNDSTVYTSKTDDQIQPKMVFLFNGDAAEILESASDLYELFPIFKQELTACLQQFDPYYGPALIDKLLNIRTAVPAQDIRQACLFSIEYALMRLFESFGIKPEIIFGERTGNYIAAVTAGIISIESAVRHFIQAQRVMKQGGNVIYARVFQKKEEAEKIVKEFEGEIFLSAVYSPSEIVISGRGTVMESVMQRLSREGVKVTKEEGEGWPSGLYQERARDFRGKLEAEVYARPKYRYVSGLSGESIRNSEKITGDFWEENLVSPIQYDKAVEFLYQQGYRFFVEVGSSPCRGENGFPVYAKDDLVRIPLLQKENSLRGILQAMAKLICLGSSIQWENFYKGYAYRKIILPNYPFDQTRYWITPPSVDSTTPGSDNDLLVTHHGDSLKGREINLPIRQKQYEFVFTRNNLPELRDNSGVVHVGYFLEMLAGTIMNLHGEIQYAVKEMEFMSPIIILEEEIKAILLVLEPGDDNDVKFQFHSRNRNQKNWNLHVQGGIHLQGNQTPSKQIFSSIDGIRDTCKENRSGEAFYKTLEERGFHFGPSVCWIDEIWFNESEAIVRFRNKTNSEGNREYALGWHPGIMDSCAQVFNFLSQGCTEKQKKYMVVNLDESAFDFASHSVPLYAHIQLSQHNEAEKEIRGSIQVVDGNGNSVTIIGGISLKEFDEEKIGALRAIMESVSSLKEGRDRDFLKIYSETNPEQKLALLTEYVRNIMAKAMEIEQQDLNVDEPLANLGIDSLIGLQFHNKIVQLLSVEISMFELIQCGTVAKTAQMLLKLLPGGEVFAGQMDESLELAESKQGADLWIYNFKPKSEAKIRIFCFPNGYRSADMYGEWQDKLGPEIDVCPIKLPGLDFERMKEKTPTDIDELMCSIEGVLSESLFDIPCVSFGHSWGSLFAYRLAYRLSKNPSANFIKLFVSGYTAPILPNSALIKILEELNLLGFNGIPNYEEIKAKPSSHEMVIKAISKAWEYEEEGVKVTLHLLLEACGLIDRFKYNDDEDFNIPIVGFHGIDDYVVTLDEMNAWEHVTSESFRLHTMAGDHQFINKSQSEDRLLKLLKENLFHCINDMEINHEKYTK